MVEQAGTCQKYLISCISSATYGQFMAGTTTDLVCFVRKSLETCLNRFLATPSLTDYTAQKSYMARNFWFFFPLTLVLLLSSRH